MIIYDYAGNEVNIDLPDKEISEIFVEVISGDETGIVTFTDGTTVHFDASDCRMMNFYDGDYCVTGANIQKWLDFKPSSKRTASYERQEMFLRV